MNYLVSQYVKLMNSKLVDSLKCKKGQTLVEYALIIVIIALAVIVAMQTLSGKISDTYTNAANSLK